MLDCLKNNCGVDLTKRCIYYLLGISTMVVFLVLILLASGLSASSKDIYNKAPTFRDSNLTLKLVHVIFRHGARTPADTYPNDPYFNESFEPFGWGQITNVGKQQMFELGEFLRARYDEFLGQQTNLDELHAQSTGVSRTKMSLQLVLAGLFPPKNTALEWNKKLNWQPIPFNYEELDNDFLLLVRKSCPRFYEELERVFNEDVNIEISKNAWLFKELSNITGWKISTPDDIQSLYSTLKKEYGLVLPDWTHKLYPQKLQELTDKSYIFNAYNDELKKLKGGVFLKKAIEDWEKKVEGNLKQKIFVYAGHDATVTNILSAFNAWEQQFPDYATTAILELSQHKETKEYGVEIFLRNSTLTDPHKLQIEGCGKFCTLNELKKVLINNIPKNWTLECEAKNSSFIPPSPSGP